MTTTIKTDVLGGPFRGFSVKQTATQYRNTDDRNIRSILVKSWNGQYASGTVNGKSRVITPFRAVNNSGDFLARNNYACGGPNPQSSSKPGYKRLFGTLPSNCDTTGVPASSCNVRFVADSSDYITFKKQQATNRNYNDIKFGGYTNSAYPDLRRVRIH